MKHFDRLPSDVADRTDQDFLKVLNPVDHRKLWQLVRVIMNTNFLQRSNILFLDLLVLDLVKHCLHDVISNKLLIVLGYEEPIVP